MLGARCGDATFDLVTLAFCSAVAEREADAVERLWTHALRARPRAVTAAYVALLGVHQLDWSIRRRAAEDVELWLGATDAALARLDR